MVIAYSLSIMKLMGMGIIAIILHELSHILMARLHGLKIKRVGLSWKGPYVVRESGTLQENFDVSMAGPLGNLLLAALFGSLAPTFGLANLVIGGVNLLPIPSSDGKRALQLLRQGALTEHKRRPPAKATASAAERSQAISPPR